MDLTLLNECFVFEDANQKFPLIFRIENFKRQIDHLGSVDDEKKIVFSNCSLFNLIPLKRHAFTWIDFHYDLLAVNFILKPLK